MAVKREKLFYNDEFQGFSSGEDYQTRILENFEWIERNDAENNPEYKQPIAYLLITNPLTKKIFAYQRAKKDADYREKRLQGKWSWGVGGHIEMSDGKNPIETSARRELIEEVSMDGKILRFKILGYINDESNSVGKVHLGMLYLVETDSPEVRPKDSESEQGKLMDLNELEKICASEGVEVENWSRIALPELKRILL